MRANILVREQKAASQNRFILRSKNPFFLRDAARPLLRMKGFLRLEGRSDPDFKLETMEPRSASRGLALEENPRFRRLLAPDDWAALPERVRARFTRKLARGDSVLYRGRTVHLKMTLAGRMLAHAARLIGAPLPLERACEERAAIVAVTEAADGEGQVWTRVYSRGRGFPQIVHSTKRFAGPTGLEEHVGGGVGMALVLKVEAGALLFKSVGYFVTVFGVRLTLPRWLSPGEMVIGHHDLGAGAFAFALTLRHPLFGAIIEQTTIFHDMEETQS